MRTLGCKRLLLVGLIVLAFLSVIAYFRIFGEKRLYIANQDSSSSVANAFAFSLIRNKQQYAKQLTSPTSWAALDHWNERHEPLSTACNLPWDPDLGGVSVGGSRDPNNNFNYSIFINFQCPEGFYTFEINDVKVERSQTGWEVVSWGKVCEEVNGNDQCYPGYP
jgi:hypothetical protein